MTSYNKSLEKVFPIVKSGGTDPSDATATAGDILLGKTAYVASGKVTGTYEPDVLIEKTITENGEYLPSDDDADGYSKVMVNVPIPVVNNKLPQVVNKTVTEITADDLAGATEIGSYAFYNCSRLTSVTIPDGVTSIGSYAFDNCSGLTSVTISDGVTSIGSYAFTYCTGLKSITIPNSITSIGSYAFSYCRGLTSVTISDGVTSIGSYAFRDCTGLKSITIPNSITSIGSYAFNNCSGLTSVTFLAVNPPTISSANVFNSTNNCLIYAYTPDDYKVATNWSTLASRIFPLVDTVQELANIDTSVYTRAMVYATKTEYTYNGTQWVEV